MLLNECYIYHLYRHRQLPPYYFFFVAIHIIRIKKKSKRTTRLTISPSLSFLLQWMMHLATTQPVSSMEITTGLDRCRYAETYTRTMSKKSEINVSIVQEEMIVRRHC